MHKLTTAWFVSLGAPSPTVGLSPYGLSLIPLPLRAAQKRSSPSSQTGSPIKRGSRFCTSQWRRGQPSGRQALSGATQLKSSETYSILNVPMAHGGGLSSAGMKFSLSASQLLASDPRLQGKTPATTAVTTWGVGCSARQSQTVQVNQSVIRC